MCRARAGVNNPGTEARASGSDAMWGKNALTVLRVPIALAVKLSRNGLALRFKDRPI